MSGRHGKARPDVDIGMHLAGTACATATAPPMPGHRGGYRSGKVEHQFGDGADGERQGVSLFAERQGIDGGGQGFPREMLWAYDGATGDGVGLGRADRAGPGEWRPAGDAGGGDLDQGGLFYAHCDGARQLDLGFCFMNPSTFPYEAGRCRPTLRVEIDGDQRSATGEHFARADGAAGIRDPAPEYIESLVAAVGGAKTEVAVTIESYSSGMVNALAGQEPAGSSAETGQFQGLCFGTAPAVADKTPAAPVIAPSQGNGGWMMSSPTQRGPP